MDGINIALKHQMAELRYHELLNEAAHQRMLDQALAEGGIAPRKIVSEARTAVANVLLRAGSWLMPEDACANPANGGFELRPGR